MNSKLKSLLILAVILIIIAGSYIAYKQLSQNFEQNAAADTASAAPESTAVPAESPEAEQKTAAADFSAIDLNGNKVKLSDYYGKPIVLNFWATWCFYCTEEMPVFQKVYEEMGQEVTFLMVNMTGSNNETVEKAKAYIVEQGYTFPVLFDIEQNVAITYSVRSIPMTIFIDSDGNFAAHSSGTLDEAALRQGLELAQKQ